MNYRWTIKTNADEENVSDLSEKLKIPLTLARVLAVRGLVDEDAINKFFNPSLDDLHDPFIMNDMNKAVDKILDSINKGLQFWVHGDYDVDGTASAAMLTLFIREIGGKVDYFIPDRFNDGYGVSNRSIDEAVKKKSSILITVDVGITSFEMLEAAADNGIETIICDHHEPGATLPKAYAILDPFLADCPYPFKPLAACGVVFKLIQAISTRIGKPELPLHYIDFVAIASAADMVPLLEENRVMLYYGLEKINNEPRTGFKSLIYCAGLKNGNITTSNIVYAIAPLINAAGRLGQAKRSVEMMIAPSEITAFRIAQQLEDENRKRRVFDQTLFEEVMPIAAQQIESGRRSLVIYGENLHAGVIGIVASRLVDRFHIPTVLLTKVENRAKGSARCLNNFDMYSSLKQCEDMLLEFGGHKHAAGISLEVDNVEEFSRRFDVIVKETISDEMLTPEIVIDSEIKFSEFSPNFFKIINKFAPFGFANNKPLFLTRGVKSTNGVKLIGMNSIRFRAIQDNFVIDAVGQNLVNKMSVIQSGKPFSIVYYLDTHIYNGQKTPQLSIKDIRAED
ncbi:MAG: single-stranded-DNA-specific exonuclease RecJ [Ignavibacteria bacterium]|nr:single-stranded-DNA-specific exonuclease RecJ [Ignavibacteria bacterium]